MTCRTQFGSLLLVASLAAFDLSGPLRAQEVGGGWEVWRQYPGTQEDDTMGWSVASQGTRRDRLLVGAPRMGLARRGMVWWFEAGLFGGIRGVFMPSSDLGGFGLAVADAGHVDSDNLPDILIGAPFSKPGGLSLAGAALVYSSSTGQLVHRWDGAAIGHALGSAVCGAGDVDGDGFDDVLIGAPGAHPNGIPGAGSALLFSGASGALLRQFDGQQSNARLGSAVAGPGDLDGDGTPDLVIGAPRTIVTGALPSGAVHVHSGATGALLYRLDDAGAYLHMALGSSLAFAGEVDGDGVADFLVGDPREQPTAASSFTGGAAVISGASGRIIFHFAGESNGENFGTSVAGDGLDLDADGVPDFAIGAPEASDPVTGLDLGAVYLFSGADGSLLRRLDPQSSPPPSFFWMFGNSVALLSDQDSDGRAEVLVGAPRAVVPGIQSDPGAAYIFDHDPWISPISDQLSASGPDSVGLRLDFPASEASTPYVMFFSRNGTGPSHYAGLDIPLSPDPIQRRIASGWQPSFVQGGRGTLGMGGTGYVSIQSAPELLPLVGRTLHVAVLTYDAVGRTPRLSSSAAAIEIIP